jgi:hypothetical protein
MEIRAGHPNPFGSHLIHQFLDVLFEPCRPLQFAMTRDTTLPYAPQLETIGQTASGEQTKPGLTPRLPGSWEMSSASSIHHGKRRASRALVSISLSLFKGSFLAGVGY